jgi:hypothetical protein
MPVSFILLGPSLNSPACTKAVNHISLRLSIYIRIYQIYSIAFCIFSYLTRRDMTEPPCHLYGQ